MTRVEEIICMTVLLIVVSIFVMAAIIIAGMIKADIDKKRMNIEERLPVDDEEYVNTDQETK